MKIYLITLLLLTLAPTVLASSAENPEIRTIGFMPYLPPIRLEESLGDYAILLGLAINKQVQFRTASTFELFSKSLLKETYDFALVQPFDYILAAEQARYRPIVKVKRDLTAIFVTLDAELLALADLQNRHLGLPPLTSAVSILGLNILREAKLKDIQVSYYRNHFSCLQSVIIGNTDACVTNSIPVENFAKEYQINFRKFYESRVLPHILFIAHERISSEEFNQFRDALTGLSNTPEGIRILARSGWPEGFEIATDEQYDVVRKLAQSQ